MMDPTPDAYEANITGKGQPSDRPRRSRLARRVVLASWLALMAVLICSGTALADSASISVTNTAGESDPAAGVPRVFTLSGTTSVAEKVFVKYRAPGGASCAPTAQSDSGKLIPNEEGDYSWYGNEANGAFSFKHAYSWEPPGTVMFCIWLAKDENTITTPITQTITFRAPSGTITAAVSPDMPQPGQQATITVTGSSEAPEKVYAKVRPAGGASCAPTYEADPGQNLIDGTSVNGAFTEQATTTQSTAGTYLICLWLASSANDTSPVAGPQPETFTVASPPPPTPPPPPPPPSPPPCVVPSFSSKMSLSTVERRIRAAHCRVGKVRYSSSERYRRGAVIKLSHRPGTKLSSNSVVWVLVSSGRPRHHKR
jgi:hypothetical protein